MKAAKRFHKKRIAALLLSIAMLLSVGSFSAFAEEAEGETLPVEDTEEELLPEENASNTASTDFFEGNEEQTGSAGASDEEEDVEQYYLKGNDEYLKLDAYDVPEGAPGSFYMEAEDGIIPGGIMRVIEDDDASGGKGIAAESGISRSIGEEIPKVDARFRINVTERGLYTIYVRMMTPASKQKSTHMTFDDDIYRRIDYSTTIGDYVWFTSNTKGITNPNYVQTSSAYLDVGVHVLNIKARQGGHIIDCILISKKGWLPKGYGSLPGEPYRYTEAELAELEYERERTDKLTIDGFKFLTDAPIEKRGGEIIVPALNLFNMMGVEVAVREDYYLATYGRDYLKLYINSDRAIANGKEIKLSTSTFLYEDNILMMPLSVVKEVFDISYSYDDSDNTTYVTTNFKTDDTIRREDKSIIETEAWLYGSKYTLKLDRPNAKIKVWLKRRPESFYKGQAQNYTKDKFSGGWKGMGGSKIDYYWGEVFEPVYENGVFKGDAGGLYRDSMYDMKVSIVDADFTDTFIIENAIHTEALSFETHTNEETVNYREYVEDEDWLVTGGELVTVPTFENISCYIDEPDAETSCEIYFREKGTDEWRKAYKPIFDTRVTGGQYRGSIVYLKEATAYEVKANILKDGKIIKTAQSECTTWSSEVPIAQTINIADIYKEGEYKPLSLIGLKGTADGWIKIVGDGKIVIDAGRDWLQSVYMSDCEYVILEGLTIKGGNKFCVNMTTGCENVRIINCDISQWGATAVLNPWLEGYIIDGNVRNLDAGIRIWDGKNIVVERCYIHDTLGSTNMWTLEGYWPWKHPAGPCAVLLGGGQGLVVRWNDMSGSDKHRFNDVMECELNSSNYAGTGFDSDIYGNLWYCNEDDSIEVDSSGRNVRIYENRSEQSLCGISTAPTNMGPLYIYRNLMVNRGNSQDVESHAIKSDQGEGMQFIFNNTMSTDIRNSSVWLHGLSRNNITTRSRNGGGGAEEIADYDIVTGEDMSPSDEYEPHGYFEKPQYVSAETGDYRLKSGTLGIDDGEALDNFSDAAVGGTDIGAFEEGGKYTMFPYRPLRASADKYFAQIADGGETTVTFTLGEIEEGLTYKIHTNLQNEFLTLEGVDCTLSGEAKSNTTYKVKIKADLSNHYMWIYNKKVPFKEGNGMLYLRLSNGLSVPVTVYVEK